MNKDIKNLLTIETLTQWALMSFFNKKKKVATMHIEHRGGDHYMFKGFTKTAIPKNAVFLVKVNPDVFLYNYKKEPYPVKRYNNADELEIGIRNDIKNLSTPIIIAGTHYNVIVMNADCMRELLMSTTTIKLMSSMSNFSITCDELNMLITILNNGKTSIEDRDTKDVKDIMCVTRKSKLVTTTDEVLLTTLMKKKYAVDLFVGHEGTSVI